MAREESMLHRVSELASTTKVQDDQRENLGEGVYRILWERILRHQIRPGDKLSDLRLSGELGVSRTPIREALQRLVQDGIVHAEHHRGFSIVSFSARDIVEIYDFRAILETGALRLALPHLDPDGLRAAVADLEAVTVRLDAAPDRDTELDAATHFLAIDRAFHRWLTQQAGNSRLTAQAESLWAQIAVFQQAGLYDPLRLRSAIHGHRQIITALRDGDGDLAAQRLEAHILEIRDLVVADHADDDASGIGANEHELADDGGGT